MKSQRVRSAGPLDARIAVVGEAPGRWEVQRGKPLVGPSGHIFNTWLTHAGLSRRDIWTGNIFEYQAPKSHINLADHAEVEAWAETIHARLPTDPWVIIPMGNVALRALQNKPLWAQASPKIGDWRGSILRYEYPEGGWAKMIPTYHPAATFKDPSLMALCLADWRRIADEATRRPRLLPIRRSLLPPHRPEDIARYLRMAAKPSTIMAFDIETNPPARHILCVGFSYRWDEALIVQWPAGTAFAKAMLASPCQKAGQFAYAYDRFWLAHEGVHVTNYVWDLIGMHHSLEAHLPHDLATQSSLYTRQPYWKTSHKESDSPTANREPIDRLMLYNGLDCMVTRELVEVYLERYAERETPCRIAQSA